MEACKQDGVLIGRGGLYSNVIRISPPLVLTPAQADEGYAVLDKAIREA
jgi:4-aminobutyrate aminotransferase